VFSNWEATRTAQMANDLYALEKLVEAVDALVTGAGRLHERLFEAAKFLMLIRQEDIPDGDLRRLFADLKNCLTSEPAEGDEGPLVTTLRAKTENEAAAIARLILDLYHELDRLPK
jgi:hypothetical protein